MTTMTFNPLPPDTDRHNIALGSVDWLAKTVRAINTWRQRQKSRAQFAGIDSRILRDAGISEAQRFIEGNKPFWEA